jgi:hypothetical protein
MDSKPQQKGSDRKPKWPSSKRLLERLVMWRIVAVQSRARPTRDETPANFSQRRSPSGGKAVHQRPARA